MNAHRVQIKWSRNWPIFCVVMIETVIIETQIKSMFLVNQITKIRLVHFLTVDFLVTGFIQVNIAHEKDHRHNRKRRVIGMTEGSLQVVGRQSKKWVNHDQNTTSQQRNTLYSWDYTRRANRPSSINCWIILRNMPPWNWSFSGVCRTCRK